MRKIPRELIPLIIFSFLFALAASAEPPDSLLSTLGKTRTARFHFLQTKTIAALERPLVSEGEMLFSRDHGILWATKTPRPSLFIITRSGISKREGDRVLADIRTRENRVVEGFAKVFLSLFSGNLSELETAFTISATSRGETWTLTLIPKDSRLGEFIKDITLSGASSISRLELHEGSGDTSHIDFSTLGPADPKLNAEELQLFLSNERAR